MKNFIYMDTNIINSYISQYNDGLKIKSNEEISDATSEEKSQAVTTRDLDSSFKFSIPTIVGIETKAAGEQEIESSNISSSQTAKELIEKIVHDNVFNNFVELLKNNEGIKSNNFNLDDFIELSGPYSIYDLDHLTNVFTTETIDTITNLEMKGKGLSTTQKKIKRKEAQAQYKEEVLDMIELCKKILPSSKFMLIENCLVMLKDDYLRDTTSNIRFTYSSNIKLIGRYTNNLNTAITNSSNNAIDDVFLSIDNITIVFLKEVLGINFDTKIIAPIALYFE